MSPKRPIIITACGSPAVPAQVRMLTQCGYPLIGMDTREDVFSAPWFEHFYTDISVDDSLYVPYLLKVCRKHAVSYVLPNHGQDLISYNVKSFLDNGTIPLVSDAETTQLCMNKQQLFEAIKTKVLVPRHCKITADTLDDQIMFVQSDPEKLCVKPLCQEGSRGFYRLCVNETYAAYFDEKKPATMSIEHLRTLLREDTEAELLLMEYINGAEYTVSVLCDNGRVIAQAPVERRFITADGISTHNVIDFNPDVMKSVEQLIAALPGLKYFVDVQVMGTKTEGYRIIDVNPRISGLVSVFETLSCNIIGLALDLAQKKNVEAIPCPVDIKKSFNLYYENALLFNETSAPIYRAENESGEDREVVIGPHRIARDEPSFIIAEIGCNFEHDLKRATEMIQAAHDAGAQAVKFQVFHPDLVATKYAEKFWDIENDGETQLDEFKLMPQLSVEEWRALKMTADKSGIVFLASAEDDEAIHMMEDIAIAAYKISSINMTNIPLIEKVARLGKPMIISTGASTIDEIKKAVTTCERVGNNQLVLLHCTSNYPTALDDVHLRKMHHMKRMFPLYAIGYSDHTCCDERIHTPTIAVAMGAKVIEKHFTYDKTRYGYDHEISADYTDFKRMIDDIRKVEATFGGYEKVPTAQEVEHLMHIRRSLTAARDIAKGAIITAGDILIRRPATGIKPVCLNDVIGKRAKRVIERDRPIVWEDVEGGKTA